MHKYTSGPWKLHPTDAIVFAESVVINQSCRDNPWKEKQMSSEERRANAILIALAPELLEAAEGLIEAGEKGKLPDGRWAFDVLREVVLKARELT